MAGDTKMPSEGYTLEPMMLAVLSRRFEAICREMTNGILKASRSAVIKNARDFSVGILTHDHRLISVEDGLPIHITALDLTTRAIDRLFDDVGEGDAFLNNCPYYGATHHADLDVIGVGPEGQQIHGHAHTQTQVSGRSLTPSLTFFISPRSHPVNRSGFTHRAGCSGWIACRGPGRADRVRRHRKYTSVSRLCRNRTPSASHWDQN